jgi:hypothetical protein
MLKHKPVCAHQSFLASSCSNRTNVQLPVWTLKDLWALAWIWLYLIIFSKAYKRNTSKSLCGFVPDRSRLLELISVLIRHYIFCLDPYSLSPAFCQLSPLYKKGRLSTSISHVLPQATTNEYWWNQKLFVVNSNKQTGKLTNDWNFRSNVPS